MKVLKDSPGIKCKYISGEKKIDLYFSILIYFEINLIIWVYMCVFSCKLPLQKAKKLLEKKTSGSGNRLRIPGTCGYSQKAANGVKNNEPDISWLNRSLGQRVIFIVVLSVCYSRRALCLHIKK